MASGHGLLNLALSPIFEAVSANPNERIERIYASGWAHRNSFSAVWTAKPAKNCHRCAGEALFGGFCTI
jgi:hypothetical protein